MPTGDARPVPTGFHTLITVRFCAIHCANDSLSHSLATYSMLGASRRGDIVK